MKARKLRDLGFRSSHSLSFGLFLHYLNCLGLHHVRADVVVFLELESVYLCVFYLLKLLVSY